jgi:4-amino-4-deoxy-L-arabinose transferase-like glycosyltransferase
MTRAFVPAAVSPQWRRLLVWTTVLWVVVFWRLGYLSLLDPDEAHYAQLTREMLRARQWLVPTLDGSPFIDKPAFFHWLQLLFVNVSGSSELALRLPSAFAAVTLIATTWWLGATLFGRRVGELGALMFATLPMTFALSTVAVFDMVFASCLFGGVACLIVHSCREQRRYLVAGYGLLGLAMMTKGPVAFVLVALFVAAMYGVPRGRDIARRLHWITGGTAAVLVAAPWFVWMWMTFRDDFVRGYVLAGNLWYFTKPEVFSTRAVIPWFYLGTIAAGFFPWSLLAVGSTLDAPRVERREPASASWLLWLWTAVVVGFFTLARFKVDYYIFPAAPALSLLAARGLCAADVSGRTRWSRAMLTFVACVLIGIAAAGGAVLLNLDLGLDRRALLLPAALAAGGGLTLAQTWRRHAPLTRSMVPLIATLVGSYALIVWLGFPALERSRPTSTLGRWVAHHAREGTAVGVYGLEDWRASLRYYCDREIAVLPTALDVESFLRAKPDAYVLMLRSELDTLRAGGISMTDVTAERGVVGRTGRYFRRQVWGDLVVAHQWPAGQ